jgi:ketosteroid isomerase-like protein
MPQDAAQAVRSLTEAWNRKDIAALVDLLHPDVEWHDRASFPDAGVHRGRAAVERHLLELAATVDLVWDVEEILEGPDGVVLCATLRGQGVESGASFEEQVYAAGIVRDGQLVRRESYSTRAEALRAVGLQE